MAQRRLRVALDANVLIAGVLSPRWPHEVMRAALAGHFDLVLPEQVVAEARRHLTDPTQAHALEFFLASSGYHEAPMPPPDEVLGQSDLVRSASDVPIAISLLASDVDVLVTSDRDFTDAGATARRFRERVHVMLPGAFLREVIGWTPDALEAIRYRSWEDREVAEAEDNNEG